MMFSIVIPVFKTEHVLKRCLDSFAAQTDGDFEVIVVDDCSPCDTRGRDAPVASARGRDAPVASEETGHFAFDAARAPRPQSEGAPRPQSEGAPRPQSEEAPRPQSEGAPRLLSASEIVAQYDARFKYVRHERNLSLFQARQTGLRMAQGEYVVPFDSDDYALPRLLEELGKVIGGESRWRWAKDDRSDKSDEYVAFSGAAQSNNQTIQQSNISPDVIVYQMMYDNGHKITKPSVRYKNELLTGAEALDRFFASKIQCAICGKAVRREVYLRAMDQLAAPRDFYLNSSEDLCQTFPILMNAQSVATISYPGYRYWLNDDSLTTTLTDPAKLGKAAENTARVFTLLKDFVRRGEVKGEGEQRIGKLDQFMRPTLRWYLSNLRHLPEAEWRACVVELNRHFAPDLIAREAMLLIGDSATYRLGRALVAPLRRILCRRS